MDSDTPTAGTPGWYPHPQMLNTLCYWDGEQWTDRTAPSSSGSGPMMVKEAKSTGDKFVTGAASVVFAVLVLALLAFLLSR